MSLTDDGKEKSEEDVARDKEKRLVEEVKDIMADVDESDLSFDEGW